MDVKKIAALKAKTLDRLSNWNLYSTFDGSYDPRFTFRDKLDDEQLRYIKCETMTVNLAMSRARETNREFEATLIQVKYEVSFELAKLLAETIDPTFAGTNEAKVEEDGEACGICQEDMEKGETVRAMEKCGHKFHDFCIFKWVKRKTDCPLCRRQMDTRKSFDSYKS